jgi:fluoride exporter
MYRKGGLLIILLAIGIGGFFGAILRNLIGLWLPELNGFPIATLLINLVGCFFLGWFLTITLSKWQISTVVRTGIGTGLAGAFTTFSTFSVDTVKLITHHYYSLAILYVGISVLGGIFLSAVGVQLGGRQTTE